MHMRQKKNSIQSLFHAATADCARYRTGLGKKRGGALWGCGEREREVKCAEGNEVGHLGAHVRLWTVSLSKVSTGTFRDARGAPIQSLEGEDLEGTSEIAASSPSTLQMREITSRQDHDPSLPGSHEP